MSNGKVHPSERCLILFQHCLKRIFEGWRTIEEFCNHLQLFLDEQKPEQVWEEAFPGRGEAIVRLLPELYSEHKFKLVLGEPGDVLFEERCRTAIFWRKIKGVRLLNLKEGLEALNAGTSLAMEIRDRVRNDYDDATWNSVAQILARNTSEFRTSLVGTYGPNLGGRLSYSLLMSLLAGASSFAGEETEREPSYKLLLWLWSIGNFPVGFDAEDNLLIVCKKKS